MPRLRSALLAALAFAVVGLGTGCEYLVSTGSDPASTSASGSSSSNSGSSTGASTGAASRSSSTGAGASSTGSSSSSSGGHAVSSTSGSGSSSSSTSSSSGSTGGAALALGAFGLQPGVLSHPRGMHALATDGQAIYVVGGVSNPQPSGPGDYVAEVEVLLPAADGGFVSQPGPGLDTPVHWPAAAVLDSNLLVFGGFDDTYSLRDLIESAPTGGGSFTDLSATLSQPLAGAVSAAWASSAYVLGGLSALADGGAWALADLDVYDGTSGVTASPGGLREARALAAACVSEPDQRLFVVGGVSYSGDSRSGVAGVESASLAGGTLGAFEAAGTLPDTRAWGGCFVESGWLYVVSGGPTAVLQAAVQADGTVGAFRTSSYALQVARDNAPMVRLGHAVVVVGGFGDPGDGGYAPLDSLEIAPLQ